MRRPPPTIIVSASTERADSRWIASMLIGLVTNKDPAIIAAACVRRAGTGRVEGAAAPGGILGASPPSAYAHLEADAHD